MVQPITTTTGRNIVRDHVRTLGRKLPAASPPFFRHYFVTRVLQTSNNLKLQELARHKNIAVTQRYAHLSDDELTRDTGRSSRKNR